MIKHTREELLFYSRVNAPFVFGPNKDLVMFQSDSCGSYLDMAPTSPRYVTNQEIWEQFKITKREMDKLVSRTFGCELSDVTGFWRTAYGLKYKDLVEILLELQELVPTSIITISNKRHRII